LEVWGAVVDVCATTGIGLVLVSMTLPAGLTALWLRMKMPALVRPFKVPLYVVVFSLAVLLSAYLLYLNYIFVIFTMWPALVVTGIVIVLILFCNYLYPGTK
ncbi:MAG: hypothetical protein HXY34_01515, partial [Candidatus Thorarchaeota archaeon]|nr:hypothetical protein [Candidatus Thorarchaeota archaeon]